MSYPSGSGIVSEAVRADRGMDVEAARAFIRSHYRKNRTVVSADIPGLLRGVEETFGLPVIQQAFRTGEDYGTWLVPPQWDVREAWLKDAEGRLIASYKDHPLFVAPYSKPGRFRVTKEELETHLYTNPQEPDAFAYNWRLAYDVQAQLKDWCLSLPQQVIDGLGPGPFDVLIDAQVQDGEMLVGEIVLPGTIRDTIVFLADYCHPGQVNDSFSGLVTLVEVMRALAGRPARRYTYKLLLLPETIGAAVYLVANRDQAALMRGAIFAEAVGWGEQWFLKATRRGNTYLDLLAEECRLAFPDLRSCPFFGLIGNDELIFDSVQAGIPALSLQKHPYLGYHTSNDEPSRLVDADLQRAYDILLHLVEVAEQDAVYAFTHPVPFLMSRFGLYADYHGDPAAFARNREIVYHLMDGRRSLLAIARQLRVPFAEVAAYAARLRQHDLVRPVDRSPWEPGW